MRLTHDSWDDIDATGRRHRRLAGAAFVHLMRAMKAGDIDSVEPWSRTYCRHTSEILALMQLKRLVLLDVYKLGYGPAYKNEAQAWLPAPEPPEEAEEDADKGLDET